MYASLEDFKTGWYGVSLALTRSDIDRLIDALTTLKSTKGHFHLRSDFQGSGGIGDVEVSIQSDHEDSNLTLDTAAAIYPKDNNA